MKYGRTFNFSAGPAMMPEPVLEEIRDEMMNYRGSGMCVMEMSHRSPVFQQIIDEAEQDLRDLMGIPDNYKVLFIQGGATLQFSMIPMNLMKNGKAVYIETGAWSKKAIAEAKKYGEVIVAASSKDKNYSYIPDCSDLDIPEDADYVYICENETGKNIAKIIKSIWLNNIMPVSKNTNIVIPKLKNSRKNTMPKRFTTCGIVRLLLSLSSISVFTTSSLVFPSSSSGLADTRASTRSAPISSVLLLPNCRSSHGCST